MRISICALVVAAGCASESVDTRLAWIGDGEAVPAGDAVELAVEATGEVSAIRFLVDGAEVGVCDPAQPEEDCMRNDVWRWTVVFAAPGTHEVTAVSDAASITRALTVVPPPTAAELEAAEIGDLLDGEELGEIDAAGELDAAKVDRGLLDPNRGSHRAFGGVAWSVKRQRVFVHGKAPTGSTAAIKRCMARYGASIRKWAAHYKVSRGSVVATAMTESSCTNPAGSSDGLSSGPMQVTASTCSAITGLSRETCRRRMHTKPDFSFQVGAKYMGSSFQRNQHHRDPPKIAAAYNAGSLRSTSSNRWHMVSTGNHIDRFVNAYNAYRKWESQHGVPLLVAEPEAVFAGEQVGSVDELPATAPTGQVIFVGDLATRDGAFVERVGETWEAIDAED